MSGDTYTPGDTGNDRRTNSKQESNSKDSGAKECEVSLTLRQKLAIHERDRHRCTNCLEYFEDPHELDVDHAVPRGKGGSNIYRNKISQCRRCHDAKEENRDHAPTIRVKSTGDMPEEDYKWCNHFFKYQIPALAELAVGHNLQVRKGLADHDAYYAFHFPIGGARRIDCLLKKEHDRYPALDQRW